MEMFENITYTHAYWVFLLPLIGVGADILTGWLQASINGTWDSTKMRTGLFRKAGELMIVVLAYLVGLAIALPVDIAAFISFYIVVMEILSILENLDQAGVPVPRWITKKLNKVQKALEEEEGEDDNVK